MPKVSVIIPNYNHAPYLKRRIDSILNQTYQDVEVILLDDSSTDNSKEILLSYQSHPKVSQIVINKQNCGNTFQQWNRGFELATGDFIWIAESDDWCEATLLETLVEPLLKDDSIVLSFCQSLIVTEQGEIVYKTETKKYEEIVFGRDFVVNKMFGDTVLVNAGMAVFRKSALADIDNGYKLMKSAGDWMFWTQIALQGNVFISGRYLNYFFRHSGSVSSIALSSGRDITEGNEVFISVLQRLNPSPFEIKNAMNKRIEIYFQQKGKFDSKYMKKEMLKKILSLHPTAKQLYIKKKRTVFFNHLFTFLNS